MTATPVRPDITRQSRITPLAWSRACQRYLTACIIWTSRYAEPLLAAARKHDWGKAHPVFQQTLHGLPVTPEEAPGEILAKQVAGVGRSRHSRPWFRHELASALAMLAVGDPDLAAYVTAAHHGRVRMSIRSMPGEVDPARPHLRVARGIIEPDDKLFEVDLGGGVLAEVRPLCLGLMDLGANATDSPGWSDRMLSLLEQEGPFRLGFLEMLLRAADESASAAGGER